MDDDDRFAAQMAAAIRRGPYVAPTVAQPKHFACLARDLLLNPPIKHRSAPVKGALSVFEFAIAASVIALARQRLTAKAHEYAHAAGEKAMRTLRKKSGAHGDTNFKQSGRTAYLAALDRFDR